MCERIAIFFGTCTSDLVFNNLLNNQPTMSKTKLILFLTFVTSPIIIFSQKTEVTHDDLATWNTISNRQISNDGQYVLYRLTNEIENPSVHIYNSKTQQTWTYPRAERPYISSDSKYVAFMIPPDQDSIKVLKRQKIKNKDMPKDSLGILDLSTMQLTKIADVQNFALPSKWSGWVAYQLEPQNEAQKIKKDTSETKVKKQKLKKESKENGSKLVIHSLSDNHRDTIHYVTDYTLAEESAGLAYTSTGNDSLLINGVYVYDFEFRAPLTVIDTSGTFKNLTFDKNGQQLAFIGDLDTTDAQVRPYELYTYQYRGTKAVVQNTSSLRHSDWIISERARLRYSKDGSRLFFGIAPQPILQDTSILKEEIVNVEVWNYKDGRLYTQQEVTKKRDADKSYLCMLDTRTRRLMQIETTDLPESVNTRDGQEENMIIYDERPYEQLLTWEGYTLSDAYLLNLTTGKKTLIGKGIQGRMRLSPLGNFAIWYNRPDTAWYSYDIRNHNTIQLTSNKIGPFYDELNDRPMPPYPSGMAGWNEKEDKVYIYDRYDIWSFHPSGKETPKRLTQGREKNIRYRYVSLDRETQHIHTTEPGMVSLFNFTNKTAGWSKINWQSGAISVLEEGPNRYRSNILKARNADALVITKEDYSTFPNLILTNTKLKNQKIISDANPQQTNRKWGNMEMVSWTSLDGIKLQGLLLKPDNFDPAKKYPMIVNFYERNSDGLYNHRPPSVGRSTINYPMYSSKDYIIFNPDIPYKNGYPGESAYNAVMPGVTKLIAEGFIDEKNIALQGHSWGGYQIAYIITRTNMFKCVESGAPVVNMFSAYGGIRWGSGMSRMFQYERTQSRIGGTIWDHPLRYLENSPLFFMDKVNTPVLIMHNDEDSAVPWEQGIEYFVALRRLGKPAWMLNYNGEPHWPVKLQNRRDFNVRMQQFFDHYLQGAPIPEWMEKGVNPINKGINQGLELMKE